MHIEKVCARCGKHCVPAQSFCPKCGTALLSATPCSAPVASAQMTVRTVEASSFEEYLGQVAAEYRAAAQAERNERLSRFPHSVMLESSFAEMDFANCWCWKEFGPCDGECWDHNSEYRVCDRAEPHSHAGKWMWVFLEKSDYDFGFCEWYFAEAADRDLFVANVEKINWGEHYAKS